MRRAATIPQKEGPAYNYHSKQSLNVRSDLTFDLLLVHSGLQNFSRVHNMPTFIHLPAQNDSECVVLVIGPNWKKRRWNGLTYPDFYGEKILASVLR